MASRPPPTPPNYPRGKDVSTVPLEPAGAAEKRPRPPNTPRPPSTRLGSLVDKAKTKLTPKRPAGPRPPSGRPLSSRLSAAWMRHKPSAAAEERKPKKPSAPRPLSGKHGPTVFTYKGNDNSYGGPSPPKGSKVDTNNPKYKGRAAMMAQKIQDNKIHHRILLAFFAVSMLWATSLAVAKSIIEDGFLPRPAMQEIGDESNILFNQADSARLGFAACTTDLLSDCQNDYSALHTLQLQLVADAQALNEEIITSFSDNRTLAKDLLNNSLNELIALGSAAVSSNANPGEECPRVLNWIEGQISAANAQNELATFNEETDAKLFQLSDSMQARQAYDDEYFANKTEAMREFGNLLADTARETSDNAFDALNATLQEMRNCLGVGGGCPSGQGFLEIQDITFEGFQLQAANFEGTINATRDAANEFYGHGAAMAGSIASIVSQINGLGLGPIAAGIPSLGSPSTPQGLNGIEPFFDGFEGPDFSVPTPDGIDASLDGFFDQALADLKAARDAAEIKLDQYASDLADFYDNFTFDVNANPPYNPPSLYAEDEIADFNNSKENTDEVVDEQLESYSSPEDNSADGFERQSRIFSNFPNSTDDLIALLPNRTFDFYAYDDELFTFIQANLLTAGDLLLWADICWRILHTMIIIHKYWNLSSIGKPPGDVRFGSSAGRKFGQKMTPDQRVAKIITHPFTIALVSGIFLALMTSAFWLAYSPFFDRYVEGCIDNSPVNIENGESNGTMFYRNAFAVAYQYAASDGDSISTKKVDEANIIRDVDCRENQEESEEIFGNQLEDYIALVQDYLEIRDFNEELIECLDLAALDTLIGGSPVLVPTTADPIFSFDIKQLDTQAVYDCGATEVCTAKCTDPSRAALQSQAHVTACTMEWWIHGSILGWMMIILTFILINWFRLEFVAAVVRIWWRRLSPGKFSFLGSCTKEGVKIYPERMEEEALSFQQVINDAVKEAVKSWEKWGYVHAVYAMLLNAPWIIFCVILSQNLVYTG